MKIPDLNFSAGGKKWADTAGLKEEARRKSGFDDRRRGRLELRQLSRIERALWGLVPNPAASLRPRNKEIKVEHVDDATNGAAFGHWDIVDLMLIHQPKDLWQRLADINAITSFFISSSSAYRRRRGRVRNVPLGDNPKNPPVVIAHQKGSDIVDVELIDNLIEREVRPYDRNLGLPTGRIKGVSLPRALA